MLNLYRRHRRDCCGQHKEESRSGETEERRRGWKRCDCPIFTSGIWDGKFRRKSTERTEWADARAAADALEKGTIPPPPAPPVNTEPTGNRTTLERAIELYHNNRKGRGIKDSTFAKYRGFTTQLKRYTDKKGYTLLAEFTTLDGDEFYGSWIDKAMAKGKKLERMKGFFDFCKKRKLITDDPVESLEPPVGYSVARPPNPYTDDELNRILTAAEQWIEKGERDADGAYYRTGATREQVVCFILLMIETGLRISDVVQFNVYERINAQTGDCFLRQHKTGKPLMTWINPELCSRLVSLARTHGPMPFDLPSKDLQHKTEVWRDERLARVFAKAGPWSTKPQPKRFRPTFARILLQRGVPVPDVAELIGDTPEIVRKHYAQWVPELQARLTDILKTTYQESQKKAWRTRVVPIKKEA